MTSSSKIAECLFALTTRIVTSTPGKLRLLVPSLLILTVTIASAIKPAADGNTAYGNGALNSNTVGTNNSAFGFQALFSNSSGQGNTATGSQSLFNNTTASGNTADGYLALFSNTTGAANTATGLQALNFNTVGNENTATGNNALFANSTGNDNTATGASAGRGNTTGAFNTVTGATALYFNTTGSFNTADGSFALNLSTGSNNIGVGYTAGINLTTGDFNIDIGNQGVTGESSTIRIGTPGNHLATFIAGINNTPVVGTPVVIDANGQLGVGVSSERFKQNIHPMEKASDTLFKLRPVTFEYNHTIEPNGTRQYGLIAEEVAKLDPNLVVHDRDGKILTVRYEAVNAMLLNEFLKEHAKVETLQATIDYQEEQIRKLGALLEQEASRIRKVEARIESEGNMRTVANTGN